ncbi:hypothetical protein [Limosilactobacillus oris]|uniref:hypothetical protein n=1 Tax=Limosilactobacillus oris TaxID=1632 RepID=UPI0024B37EE1|nr:hypothetical protein [Limosilactobacillus oris]WHO85083.1 hypothetical protein QLX69_06840 [Limosilactobacillus oris]
MKHITELDFALGDLQLNNKTLSGLLNVLTDTFDNICSPIDHDGQITDGQRSLTIYELLRDKNSIDALLDSLKHFTSEQDKKLADTYNQFIINSERAE